MRFSIKASLWLLLIGTCYSQQTISAFNVPIVRANETTLWDHVMAPAVLNSPLFTGFTWSVPAGCSGCSNGGYLDQSGTDTDGGYCPALDFSAMDATMNLVAAKGKLNNLILQGAKFTNNDATPVGVFGQHFADNLDTDCATMNPVLFRVNGQKYSPGDYICVGGVWPSCTGGNYWQETAFGTNADVNDNHVTVAGSSPGCLTSIPGADCPDGTGATAALWHSLGAHGQPLDSWCDANTTGVAQLNCWKISASTSSNSSITGNVATLALASNQTYTNGQKGTMTGALGPAGASNFNCSGANTATITDVSVPGQVKYTCAPVSLTNTAALTLTGGTFSQSQSTGHFINANTTNVTLTVVANQLPIPWELPMKTWRSYVFAQALAHWKTGNIPSITYGRNGLTKAGESDTSGSNNWPYLADGTVIGASNVQAHFLSYENDMFKANKLAGCGSLVACVANLHTYGDQEAAYAYAQNIGFDNNALDVAQVIQLVGGFCLTMSSQLPDSHSGNWCNAFSSYSAPMSNGIHTINNLQTGGSGNYGSPGNCQIGFPGSLALDTTCVSAGVVTSAGSTVNLISGSSFASGWASSTNPASIDISGSPFVVTAFNNGSQIVVTGTPAAVLAPYTFPDPFTVSFPGWMPQAKQYGATNIELYLCDLLLATDINYGSLFAGDCPTRYSQATYQAGYIAALTAFLVNPISGGNSFGAGTNAAHGKIVIK